MEKITNALMIARADESDRLMVEKHLDRLRNQHLLEFERKTVRNDAK
jgi:hypothetical protein